MFIEIFLQLTDEIKWRPLVISKSPVSNPEIKSVFIFRKLKNGDISLEQRLKRPLDLNIEIIVEKRTTKPPIKKIVLIAFIMLSDKISPKLENENACIFFLETLLDFIFNVFESFFQNLKIIPTVIQANICVIKSRIPIIVF